ncbi:hypothetical protein GSI_10728 [Ganoderma sinense ZZ0214-1]|uniref:Transporter n=1 Tax=Ganoderma sinense ZZ0214-1 TaxID=1077348 RepID=A0A2G8S1G9_9APHY|nr:hypothetical protein GSI_10728 [Ganoderma sinense ZZ0214-1]
MKFFSQLVSFVPVVVLGAVGAMAQSSDVVITAIGGFTATTSSLCTTCNNLSILNFLTSGFEIAQGLGNITTAIASFNAEFSSTTVAYSDAVAIQVVSVLTTFVEVQQELLNIVISKHSLAAQFLLTAPIAAALTLCKGVIDTFFVGVIALIPTQCGPAQTQISAWNATFTECITTYSS